MREKTLHIFFYPPQKIIIDYVSPSLDPLVGPYIH